MSLVDLLEVPLEKSFFSMHEPVPENQNLLRASNKIVELISEENKQFRRFVWTISSLPTLSQLPLYKRPQPETIDDLYFRTEVQTTVGLGNGISLFFVKVEMYPLSIVWIDMDKRIQIIESISSMSPAIHEYKNLKNIKEILLKNNKDYNPLMLSEQVGGIDDCLKTRKRIPDFHFYRRMKTESNEKLKLIVFSFTTKDFGLTL